MPNRYCGRARLLCRFDDAAEEYACVIYVGDERRGAQRVGLPGAWSTLPEFRNGVDSDEAFDSAARAAVGFALYGAEDERMLADDEVDYDQELCGPLVTRRPPPGVDPQLDLLFKGRW